MINFIKRKPVQAVCILIFLIVLALLIIANRADKIHAQSSGPGDRLLVAMAAGDQCVGTSGYTCAEIAAMQFLPETGGDLSASAADLYLDDTQVNGLAGIVVGILCGLVMGLAVGIRWSRR